MPARPRFQMAAAFSLKGARTRSPMLRVQGTPPRYASEKRILSWINTPRAGWCFTVEYSVAGRAYGNVTRNALKQAQCWSLPPKKHC
jgi:hypothetical protein